MVDIKTLTIRDIPQAKILSDAEGWNQTISDWKLLISSPGNVCLALTANEKIIATATAMTYERQLAWIGMVLVDREYRGKGLSKLLMQALLDKLQSFRSVQLDATPAGEPVYQRLGFIPVCLVYRMTASALNPETLTAKRDGFVEPVNDAAVDEISKYDQRVTGINRRVLLDYLVDTSPESSFVLIKHGKIEGYVTGRAGSRFHQLGPLVADAYEDAKLLLAGALMNKEGGPVLVDVPEGRQELIGWMKSAGFTVQRHFMRMYLEGYPSSGIPENCFLIAGPEFG